MTRSMLLDHSPDQVLRQLMVDQSIGVTGGTDGEWPIFCSQEPESPDECITLAWTIGQLEGVFQINGETQEQYGISIRVRGLGYQSAYAKVKEILTKLEQETLMDSVAVPPEVGTGPSTNYVVECCTRASGPLYLGMERDNADRDVFTINYLATITQ